MNAETQHDVVMIYDITTDEKRPVTQADVDRLQAIESYVGGLRYLLRRILGFAPAPVPITDWKTEAGLVRRVTESFDNVTLNLR